MIDWLRKINSIKTFFNSLRCPKPSSLSLRPLYSPDSSRVPWLILQKVSYVWASLTTQYKRVTSISSLDWWPSARNKNEKSIFYYQKSKKIHSSLLEILLMKKSWNTISWEQYKHCTKKWSFPLRISSVNVIISSISCGFGHIYWRNP